MVRRSVFVLMLIALCLPVSAAFAQTVSATTGTVIGKVTDESDAVLPGVSITIKGPAMMGVQTAVTDGEGMYRLTAIPPGSYALDFELQGFATNHRQGIAVGSGFTATINVKLGMATLTEAVRCACRSAHGNS